MRDENSKKSKVNTWVVLSLFPFCSHFLEIVLFVFSKEFLFFAFLQVFILLDILFWLLKLSWSKKLVRKWFNIKGKTEEFQSDEVVYGGRYLMSSGFELEKKRETLFWWIGVFLKLWALEYLCEVVVRFAFILPSWDLTYGISVVMLLLYEQLEVNLLLFSLFSVCCFILEVDG